MPSAVRVTLLCVFFLVFLNDHLFQFHGTGRRRSWGVPATTIARFDDLSQIFPSQLETSHVRSHLFYPFGGSSQDHEQGRHQTYHMFRQRHTRSNVFRLSVCLSVFYLIEQVKFFWQLLADVDLLYFHRGQPQHREHHALLFSNNVWVL